MSKELQFEEAQRVAHLGSWQWDLASGELTWSDELYRIYGLDPAAGISYERYLSSIHPDDRPRALEIIKQARELNVPYVFDHRIVWPDGSIRYVQGRGRVVTDEQGTPVRMIGTGLDITEQKAAEEEVRRLNVRLEKRVADRTAALESANRELQIEIAERSEAQAAIAHLNQEASRRATELQTLMDVLPIGICVAHDAQCTKITTNPAAAELLRITPGTNASKSNPAGARLPFKVLRGDEEVLPDDLPMQRAAATAAPIRDLELDIEFADGSRRNLLEYASPLFDEDGAVRGCLGVLVDISQLKEIQRRLAIQYEVSRTLASSTTREAAFPEVLRTICEGLDWAFGALWQVDREALVLRNMATWQAPELVDDEFLAASRQITFGLGAGLPGRVWNEKRPVLIPHLPQEANLARADAAHKAGLRATAAFPILDGDEVTAVIECYSVHSGQFRSDLEELLIALGRQLATFIERLRVEESLAMRARQQAVVAALGQAALSEENLQDLLDEIAAQLARTLGTHYAAVFEHLPGSHAYLVRAGTGWHAGVTGAHQVPVPPGSFLRFVLDHENPVAVPDLQADTRFHLSPLLSGHDVVSALAVQVRAAGHLFGIVGVFDVQRRVFNQDDIHFMQATCHVLAAALERRQSEEALRISRNELAVILQGVADGITAQDRQGNLIYANDAAAHIIGFPSAAALLAEPPSTIVERFELFDEQDQPYSLADLPGRRVLQGKPAPPQTIRFRVKATGVERWSIVKAQPVVNPAGETQMAVNIFQDISDLKRTEQIQRLQSDVGMLLSASLDYVERLDAMARLVVPQLADWCAIHVVDGEDTLHQIAVAHMDPAKVELAREMQNRFPARPEDRTGIYNVLRTGQPELYPEVTDAMLAAGASSEEHLAYARSLQIHSVMIVPLIARGRPLGTLTLVWAESGYRYNANDLLIVEELARRAALSIDNARLYVEAQRLNARLEERVAERTTQLESSIRLLKREIGQRQRAEEQIKQLNVELEQRVVERTAQLAATNKQLEREIEERKRTEAFLQRQAATLREQAHLLDLAYDTIMVRSMQNRIVFWNHGAEEMYGWSKEEAVGRVPYTLLQTRFPMPLRAIEEQVLQAGRWEGELVQARRDGSEIVVSSRWALWRDDAGKPLAILEINNEITQRKQVEEALRYALARARELYELSQGIGAVRTVEDVLRVLLSSSYLEHCMRAAVIEFDGPWRSGGPAPRYGTILAEVNQTGDAIRIGGERYDLVANEFLQFYSRSEPVVVEEPANDARLAADVRALLAAQGTHSMMFLPLHGGGEWYGILVLHFGNERSVGQSDIRHVRGLVDQAAIAINNIRLLQAEAAARREAEQANDLKLKFLAMISHELRTPLASIKGFATTLLAEDVTWDAASQRDFVETIDQEADKLTELIEQLLDLSRLQAGSLRIRRRPMVLGVALEIAMAELETLTRNHSLDLKIDDDLPMVFIDPSRIAQVLVNLVNNAVKFSPAGSTITIAARGAAEAIQVDISDEGPGVPEQDREHVFEAFRRGHDVREDRGKGMGLGLAICAGIINAHHGRIWIQDGTKIGATFSFTIPLPETEIVVEDNGADSSEKSSDKTGKHTNRHE